jgi:broad specificity phosphatase PhoE
VTPTRASGPVARRIVLVRHGRPAVARDYPRDRWVAGRELPGLLAAYDASGLDSSSEPSDELRTRVAGVSGVSGAQRVFVSDLPRARESAARLGLLGSAPGEALFREAMPPTGLPAGWRLPLAVWLFVSRGLWFACLRLEGETHAQARRRAEAAADRLEQAADEGLQVVLVAHGWINWLIREALIRRGWQARGPYAREHWAYNELTRR